MEKIQKKALLLLGAILLVAFFISIVSAATPVENIKSIGSGIFEIVKPLAESILGETPGGDFLFAKVLLLIMLFGIIWEVVGSIDFFKNGYILFIVSAGVSILSIRWLTAGLVQTILLPYTTIGIVISAGIPFVIFFLLVNRGLKGSSSTLRRTAWIFFAVIFIGLWISRINTEELGSESYMYLIVALAALLMAYLDGTIKRFFSKISVSKKLRIFDDVEYMRRKKENKEFYASYTTLVATGDPDDYTKAKKIWEKIERNEKQMIKLESGESDKSSTLRNTFRIPSN